MNHFQPYARSMQMAGGPLYASDAYNLARIRGEAFALQACVPHNRQILTECCIILGYVDGFAFYGRDSFPWGYVIEKLKRLRKRVVAALCPPKPVVRRPLGYQRMKTPFRRKFAGRLVSVAWLNARAA